MTARHLEGKVNAREAIGHACTNSHNGCVSILDELGRFDSGRGPLTKYI